MKAHTALFPCTFVLSTIVTLAGVKEFQAWSQITYLWEGGVSPFLIVEQAHFFRYLITYPGFLFEVMLPGLGFSLYISLFFSLNVSLFYRIVRLARGRPPPVWCWLVFISAHLFMNGRGVLAWAGWLICVLGCLELTRQHPGMLRTIAMATVSLLLASVSTGVFIVTFSAWFVSAMLRMSRARLRITPTVLIGCFAGIYVAIEAIGYFILAVEKNLEFYGGGLSGAVSMLSHGLGTVIVDSDTTLDIDPLIFGLAAIPIALLSLALALGLPPLSRQIVIAAAGGLFGYTVLTLTIPPTLILLVSGRRDSRSTSTL